MTQTPPGQAFLLRPLHWLLAAAPIAAALDAAGAPAPLVFLLAGLALVPLATLIVHSTEEIAARTGPAIGGLLNATFGNLPELIIALVAMRAGLLGMVRASLIGALLANLLLALGVAFLLGGRRHHVQEYNPAAARTCAREPLRSTRAADARLQPGRGRRSSSGARSRITLAGDGRANWFKSAQLVGFYLILAALFYLLPEVAA